MNKNIVEKKHRLCRANFLKLRLHKIEYFVRTSGEDNRKKDLTRIPELLSFCVQRFIRSPRTSQMAVGPSDGRPTRSETGTIESIFMFSGNSEGRPFITSRQTSYPSRLVKHTICSYFFLKTFFSGDLWGPSYVTPHFVSSLWVPLERSGTLQESFL